jgi:hypothetical protein
LRKWQDNGDSCGVAVIEGSLMKDSERARHEWSRYKVGSPSARPNWTNADCSPLDAVYHICHVDEAFRDFEDGRIWASLVRDESRLRKTRACVSWVSSNLWAAGSIYGNIRFEFDWDELIEGKRFYWVEDMRMYSPPAYRILVTAADRSEIGLTRYIPEKGEGPLFHDVKSGIWYRNGKFNGEFMIEGELPLGNCRMVGFEDHHAKCRRLECADRSKKGVDSGAELLARLAAHNIRRWVKLFRDPDAHDRLLHIEAQLAWARMRKSLKMEPDSGGALTHDHPAASPIVSAILDRYGWSRPNGRAQLCNLFKNTEELRLALTERMVRALGLPSAKALGAEED